ncbi:MAG TPA: 4-hydroxy-tetrahydrodipicolinate reductase [Chitinophagaceae bacterium]|nr:4-hydroxy-tetrahydrodipicolinate reductase [Chitinophagaceae bacterium]
MNIALIGYGKMGKAIEEIALQKGHKIVIKIDQDNFDEFTRENLSQADAAIEFTNPHSAFENIKKCIEFGIPVVSGSTGWTDKLDELKVLCQQKNSAFIYASNFSIGVNIFFEINKKLASMMDYLPDYNVTLEEIHHTQKKDAPSGTAITLAEGILEKVERKKKWVNSISSNPDDLVIVSKRIDPAAGTHSIKYTSAIDDIEIIHTAHNRKGFAAGAVLAAEYIIGKKGFFTMKDVLNI